MESTMAAKLGELETQLKQWAAKLDELAAKADTVSADAKADYRKRINDLKVRHRVAQARLEELRTAGTGAWDKLMAGVDSAWKALEGAFKKMTN